MAFLLVFGIGTVVLGLYLIVSFLVGLRRREVIGRWPAVAGTVLSSMVQTFEPRKGQKAEVRYTPLVMYSYTVDGQPFTGQKLDFKAPRSFATKAEAEAMAAKYPAGGAVKVTYNPLGPEQAALDPAKPTGYATGLITGILLVMAGAGMIVLAVLMMANGQGNGAALAYFCVV